MAAEIFRTRTRKRQIIFGGSNRRATLVCAKLAAVLHLAARNTVLFPAGINVSWLTFAGKRKVAGPQYSTAGRGILWLKLLMIASSDRYICIGILITLDRGAWEKADQSRNRQTTGRDLFCSTLARGIREILAGKASSPDSDGLHARMIKAA
ncbi:uncharacterized protein CIMG_12740 [Coccidioides immitis RS]|uniref:Uncharacterized protein n=1 Tax=Coccidioides immitis (strain RS) TaxID=246410 RepID=A0A0D8JSY7_COCIM|nr:uncharacterized protein CIMG_12740 [Coccidioides immitis RS]KJF60091.1 hypothetical protein CIMG_12740 [Coccidioides immitis RS]